MKKRCKLTESKENYSKLADFPILFNGLMMLLASNFYDEFQLLIGAHYSTVEDKTNAISIYLQQTKNNVCQAIRTFSPDKHLYEQQCYFYNEVLEEYTKKIARGMMAQRAMRDTLEKAFISSYFAIPC